jgi:hypothetical protein
LSSYTPVPLATTSPGYEPWIYAIVPWFSCWQASHVCSPPTQMEYGDSNLTQNHYEYLVHLELKYA